MIFWNQFRTGWVIAALVSVCALPGSRAIAGEELLENAVGVFVSPRGQDYLYRNFESVLFANGYSLREGVIPNWDYQSQEAVSLDRLPPQFAQLSDTFQKIRALLERWLKGFHLNDPRLAVYLKDIGYSAEFTRLGFRADYGALRDLKLDNAVVLVAEAEIPALRVRVGSVKATDLNNPFLGHIGIKGFWSAISGGGEPLKIKIPLLVELSRKTGLRVQVLRFATNLPSVQMGFGFEKPLVLPKVEVIINGHKMELDHGAIEDDLLVHQAALVQAMQGFLKNKLEEQVPEILTAIISDKFGHIRDENEMAPPGAPEGRVASNFRWGLVPEEVRHTPASLYLGLAAFVEDPSNQRHVPLRGVVRARGLPAPSSKADGKYDIALTLNQGLLNRVLQLSHERGYFKKIPSSEKGSFIRLADAPYFRFDRAGDRVSLRVAVLYEPKGMERVAINGPLRVSFDLNARLSRNGRGGIAIIKERIDANTVEIDRKAIRFGFLEARVRKGVSERIAAENAEMKKNPSPLADGLPVPEALFGVPIAINGFEVLPSGYLIFYTEFGI